MSFFVPTRFVWRFGGQQVHLCGSFTRWVETVQMPPVPDAPGMFAVVVHLPPGYHQYKFIVDGEWRHDETQPNMPDPLGNVNNWLFVRRTEPLSGSEPMLQPQYSSQQMLEQQALEKQQEEAAKNLEERNAAGSEDVDMAEHSGVVAPIALQPDEPLAAAAEMTKKKVMEFLANHTAYELIPESGKVVLLDTELPVRQAFHALYEQGIASAPLWDTESASIVGMISASDFIQILRHLRNSVSSGGNPLSEQEMDEHTIKHMREEAALLGNSAESLVHCQPDDSLKVVAQTLFEAGHSMAPVLTSDAAGSASEDGSKIPNLLHVATISGVLACLLRHFRASLSSLPLLSHPLGSLPLGSWIAGVEEEGEETKERGAKKIGHLQTVGLNTPLTTALQLLLEKGISSLPVVDDNGMLLDVYSRSDITMLAKGNAYSRLQYEDLTVGQALALASAKPTMSSSAPALQQPPGSTLTPPNMMATGAASGGHSVGSIPAGSGPGGGQRMFICTKRDSLRTVVERLSIPGVRRLIAVHPETRCVEGIVSLSDIAAYMFVQ
eukprot:CAMPEP_0117653972 /NCGR_PEP_ID=MMETSP0804-20121206/3489_1 /TAXON_ID=1074897 /ORGANISM="Tetraselmis astigmatica, Strain CCMP880" /LENGTH=551 /DNA_ID=CAMNT_0005460209 /DNA_START=679 /DNA_END=2334 /DNA_ORIENTATION=+